MLGVDNLSASLGEATNGIEKLMQQLASEQMVDVAWNSVSTAIDGITMLVSVSGPVKNAVSLIGEYIAAVQTAIPEVGTLAAMFPTLSSGLMSIGQWFGNTGKVICDMIAQLAASAAAWVAETAAKVASTAASWAQIAATTAWKVLCVAATAVTTAFGAAMTFLTSPIGLVVVA